MARSVKPGILELRRKFASRLAWLVTIRLAATSFVVIVPGLLFLYFLLQGFYINEQNAFAWFATCFVIILANWIWMIVIRMKAERVFDAFAQSQDELASDVRSIIDDKLSPHIIPIDGKGEVQKMAANIIEDMLNSSTGDRKLTFIGAAALMPSADEESRIIDKETEPENHPSMRYKNAFERCKIQSESVEIVRYIRLFRQEEFKARSSTIRQKHVSWLRGQAAHIEQAGNYTLYASERAPVWGGARSSIITPEAVLDIVGEGEAALLVRGEALARLIQARTESFLKAARQKSNKPNPFTQGKVPQLLSLIQQLEGG